MDPNPLTLLYSKVYVPTVPLVVRTVPKGTVVVLSKMKRSCGIRLPTEICPVASCDVKNSTLFRGGSTVWEFKQ